MIEKARNWLNFGNNFLYTLLGVSLLIRLAYILPLPVDKLSPDAYDWSNLGWAIAQGNGLGSSWRPPGYAFFLGTIFFVFGRSVIAARAIQALLGAFTCLLTYKTGERIFSKTTGKIAGVLTCFYPYFIAYTGDLLSETFLTFMIALAVYHVVKTSEIPSWKNIALTGALIGLTGLAKSTTLPFFLLACGWLWWQTGKFRTGFMVGVFTLLALAPWTFRNYFHYDKSYVMPINSPWCSLYGSSCDEALLNETLGDRLKGPGVKPIDQFLPPEVDYAFSLPLPERDKFCREKALGWIKNNPDKFSWLLYKRFFHFWRLYPMIAYKGEKIAAIATSGLYFPLAAIGIFLSLAMFKKTSLLMALFLSYTVVHLFFATMIRYRVPIDPFVLIFTAYTLERGYTALKARRSRKS